MYSRSTYSSSILFSTISTSNTTEGEPPHLPGPQFPTSLPWLPNNQPPERGTRLYQLHLPRSPAGRITGAGQLWNQHSTLPSQSTAVSQWSMPSQRWHSTPQTCPHSLTQWSTHLCHQGLHLPGPLSYLWADRFSGLSNCVGQTSPTLLPAAHSGLWYNTTFKQEPHHPTLNHLAHPLYPQHNGLMTTHHLHLFHSTCIFHPFCSHTFTGHPCPYGSTKGPLRAWVTQVDLQQTLSRLSKNRWADGTVSPGWNCLSGGSWPWIFTDLTAFCLWFPTEHPLLYPLPIPGYQDPPSSRKPPHIQGQKPTWMVHGVSAIQWWSWSSSSEGALAWVIQPTGKEAAQGTVYSWSSGSSRPNAGPWVRCHRKGRDDDPFLGKHLSDVNWAI